MVKGDIPLVSQSARSQVLSSQVPVPQSPAVILDRQKLVAWVPSSWWSSHGYNSLGYLSV